MLSLFAQLNNRKVNIMASKIKDIFNSTIKYLRCPKQETLNRMLGSAVIQDNLNIAQFAINRGADINGAFVYEQGTFMNFSKRNNDFEFMKHSFLEEAVINGSDAMIDLFIQNKADVNNRNLLYLTFNTRFEKPSFVEIFKDLVDVDAPYNKIISEGKEPYTILDKVVKAKSIYTDESKIKKINKIAGILKLVGAKSFKDLPPIIEVKPIVVEETVVQPKKQKFRFK